MPLAANAPDASSKDDRAEIPQVRAVTGCTLAYLTAGIVASFSGRNWEFVLG